MSALVHSRRRDYCQLHRMAVPTVVFRNRDGSTRQIVPSSARSESGGSFATTFLMYQPVRSDRTTTPPARGSTCRGKHPVAAMSSAATATIPLILNEDFDMVVRLRSTFPSFAVRHVPGGVV